MKQNKKKIRVCFCLNSRGVIFHLDVFIIKLQFIHFYIYHTNLSIILFVSCIYFYIISTLHSYPFSFNNTSSLDSVLFLPIVFSSCFFVSILFCLCNANCFAINPSVAKSGNPPVFFCSG